MQELVGSKRKKTSDRKEQDMEESSSPIKI